MANIKNIIGDKYGKLTVLELIDSNNKSKTRYLCKCECGNLHETSGDSLRGGKSKSCGCLKKAYIPKTFNKNRKQQILIQLYKSTIEKRSKMRGWIDCIGFELFTQRLKRKPTYFSRGRMSVSKKQFKKNGKYIIESKC